MTEERNCGTCKFASFNNGTVKSCTLLGVSGCIGYIKWQPITKPKVQMTEEEAMCFYRMAGDGHVEFIKRLKQLGYIRKSPLIELVEEAEWIYENYQSAKYCLTTDEALEKNHDALQALKKDHPEFGGKK